MLQDCYIPHSFIGGDLVAALLVGYRTMIFIKQPGKEVFHSTVTSSLAGHCIYLDLHYMLAVFAMCVGPAATS